MHPLLAHCWLLDISMSLASTFRIALLTVASTLLPACAFASGSLSIAVRAFGPGVIEICPGLTEPTIRDVHPCLEKSVVLMRNTLTEPTYQTLA